jgi:phosphotransferase system  glucose/maltose/N-acetylglucosamine-specific IIC component
MRWYNYLMFSVFVGILFFLILNNNLHNHENVHKAIFSYDNCKNVSIKYNIVAGTTTCYDKDYNESESGHILNGYNEIIGYNLDTVILCFFALIMVITLFGCLILNKKAVV